MHTNPRCTAMLACCVHELTKQSLAVTPPHPPTQRGSQHSRVALSAVRKQRFPPQLAGQTVRVTVACNEKQVFTVTIVKLIITVMLCKPNSSVIKKGIHKGFYTMFSRVATHSECSQPGSHSCHCSNTPRSQCGNMVM